ncbi:hypothetical protein EB72_11730 [Mycobacterium sp. SWH-M1]|nr:hypothetical protein EB72_11730 [Mycobacterium sp. SWH-M1]
MDLAEYWRVTGLITVVSGSIAVGDRAEVTDEIQQLLDVDHELLQRALCNFGAAAYGVFADATSISLQRASYLLALLTPNALDGIAVELSGEDWESTVAQVWGCLTHDPKETGPLGGTHFTITASAVSPAAAVLNSAMCVIVPLLKKCEVLQPRDRPRPLDPRREGSRFSDGLVGVLDKLRGWLPPAE